MVLPAIRPLFRIFGSSQTGFLPCLALLGFVLGSAFFLVGFFLNQTVQDTWSPIHPTSKKAVERSLESQVDVDLAPFKNSMISSGISLQQVERVYCNFDHGGFRLQILDGKMYVVGERWGLQTRVRNTKLMLLHLMHKYKLPDVDISWISCDDAVADLFKGHSDKCPTPGPILVMTKMPHHDHAIMYPDFSFLDWEEAYAVPWQDIPHVMERAANTTAWDDRIPKLFTRAFNLGESRNALHDNEAALNSGELMDSHIIDWHADPDSFVSLQDHCRYKWLLHTAGNTYSARLKYLLFCRSAVVFPDSPWQEFFYHMLTPGHNIVRIVAMTLGNQAIHLPFVAEYLNSHDAESEKIGAAGAAFANEFLNSDSVDRYYKRLIEAYSQLMTFNVTVHADAVPIEKSLMKDSARPFDKRTCDICPRV